MFIRRSVVFILVLTCQWFVLTGSAVAHPASGIVIDAQGHVYFAYSLHGVVRIEESPTGNGPGHIGGHGRDAQHRRLDGWWPRYPWRNTGWPLTDQHPVSNVPWNDASAFCKWLSEKSGRRVRL